MESPITLAFNGAEQFAAIRGGLPEGMDLPLSVIGARLGGSGPPREDALRHDAVERLALASDPLERAAVRQLDPLLDAKAVGGVDFCVVQHQLHDCPDLQLAPRHATPSSHLLPAQRCNGVADACKA